MKTFFREFKEFALKGNVIDLAIGVIIGAAFQGVVNSLTTNILSPLIGLLVQQNFDSLTWDIFGVTIQYGAFISSVINFLIMAFVIFLFVKAINKLKKTKPEEPQKEERLCPYCKTAIHDEATRCPHCTSELPAFAATQE